MHIYSLATATKGTNEDILDFFELAARERRKAPGQSVAIARIVFDATDPYVLGFEPAPLVLRLRNEFGALEAPGQPANEASDLGAYERQLWQRLELLIQDGRSWLAAHDA